MVNTRMHGTEPGHEERLLSTDYTLARLTFRRADIPSVRPFAAAFGVRAGMGSPALADFVLAVSEAAACSVSHGPCTARLRLWQAGPRVFCEVRGDGILLGQGPRAVERSDAEALRRRLLRRICDHARVESGSHGVTVRFSITIT